ncbi:MAG: FtsW/RodA/SpoVE family cell cycle protein [Actinomycetota bacterium]|nr:FtsW/RodA/SpoVE family cell cycle protein [Actinomycetota bacterium]
MALTTTAPPAQVSAPPAPRRVATSPAWRHFDPLLLLAAGAVTLVGVIMVYATTRYPLALSGANPKAELERQAIWAVLGVAACAATLVFDYKRYLSWAPVLYAGTLLALAAALVIGHRILGAQSWIQVGPFQFEPSEFAKITLIMSLASLLASRKGAISIRVLLLVLGLSAIPLLLIFKQDALGSAIVLGVVMVGMLLMGGTKGRHMVVLTVLAIVAIVGVLQSGVLKQYQRDRLTTFLHAPSGLSQGTVSSSNPYARTIEYNLDQSKVAIANGGLYGRGLFRGQMTDLSYVPNQSTDFIFTAAAEQFGFAGSALLLALFALIVWRTWRAATLSRDLAGTLICTGALCMITFQIFENIGMTMGIMPVAGITLPFMSYGGSAMVVDWVAVGLVQNVRMRRFS